MALLLLLGCRAADPPAPPQTASVGPAVAVDLATCLVIRVEATRVVVASPGGTPVETPPDALDAALRAAPLDSQVAIVVAPGAPSPAIRSAVESVRRAGLRRLALAVE